MALFLSVYIWDISNPYITCPGVPLLFGACILDQSDVLFLGLGYSSKSVSEPSSAMAEPLGILASLISVVQISSKVISICYEFRSGVKKAPRDLTRITSEVTSLRDIVEQLIRVVDEDCLVKSSRLHTIGTLNQPGGPLIKLQYELETLGTKLKPERGWNTVGQALMWPLREVM